MSRGHALVCPLGLLARPGVLCIGDVMRAALLWGNVSGMALHNLSRLPTLAALSLLHSSKLSLGQRTNTLVVLSGLLLAAGRTQQALSGSLLATLANALVSEELRGALDHPAARQQMLAVATNVMRWVGSRCVGSRHAPGMAACYQISFACGGFAGPGCGQFAGQGLHLNRDPAHLHMWQTFLW